MTRHAAVIERAGEKLACVPDLPGCVATGAGVAAVEREIAEVVRLHLVAAWRTGRPSPSRASRPSTSRPEAPAGGLAGRPPRRA